MRRSTVIISVLVVLAGLVGGVLTVLFAPTTEELTSEPDTNPEIVTLPGDESGFWPYLNTKHEFQKDSSINVVVRGNTTQVINAMQTQTAAEWTAPPPDQAIKWGTAGWPDHYAYVHNGTNGEWIDMTAELQDGDYYGARYHARLYESPRPDEKWVLIQAHTEHFDWFLLRHTPTSTEQGQHHVESDFATYTAVDKIWHIRLGNGDSWDSDGQATVVELALVLPVVLLGTIPSGRWPSHVTVVSKQLLHTVRRRVTWRHALLAGALVSLLLGVRIAGITLERYGGFRSMTMIAALLFPFVSVGIPVVTYGIAHRMESRIDTALTAALALSIAIVLDFAIVLDYLSVNDNVLPLEIIVQRTGVVVAIGLIAGGASHRTTLSNGMLVSGALLWGGLVAGGLLNLI